MTFFFSCKVNEKYLSVTEPLFEMINLTLTSFSFSNCASTLLPFHQNKGDSFQMNPLIVEAMYFLQAHKAPHKIGMVTPVRNCHSIFQPYQNDWLRQSNLIPNSADSSVLVQYVYVPPIGQCSLPAKHQQQNDILIAALILFLQHFGLVEAFKGYNTQILV